MIELGSLKSLGFVLRKFKKTWCKPWKEGFFLGNNSLIQL